MACSGSGVKQLRTGAYHEQRSDTFRRRCKPNMAQCHGQVSHSEPTAATTATVFYQHGEGIAMCKIFAPRNLILSASSSRRRHVVKRHVVPSQLHVLRSNICCACFTTHA